MKDFSYITNQHPSYIENLYQDFQKNPESIDIDIRKFFEGFDFAITNLSKNDVGDTTESSSLPLDFDLAKEIAVYRLILGYKNKGHLIATTNPIRERKNRGANLELSFFGLTEADLTSTFYAGIFLNLQKTSLKLILQHLQNVYASNIGLEYKYINDQDKVDWLTQEIEVKCLQPLPINKRKRILEKLNEGVIFEKFLHTKYIGQKRFSLEGGETTIAALDAIINTAANNDVEEVVIGMAHRGRLNILANIMGKTYEQIFSEFEGTAKSRYNHGQWRCEISYGFW